MSAVVDLVLTAGLMRAEPLGIEGSTDNLSWFGCEDVVELAWRVVTVAYAQRACPYLSGSYGPPISPGRVVSSRAACWRSASLAAAMLSC